MNTSQVFFAQMVGMVATADGSVIVGARVGLDQQARALGTGYWRIAPDGAITPLHSRSTNTYGKTPTTKCDAPYSRTHLDPENFALAPDGRLVKADRICDREDRRRWVRASESPVNRSPARKAVRRPAFAAPRMARPMRRASTKRRRARRSAWQRLDRRSDRLLAAPPRHRREGHDGHQRRAILRQDIVREDQPALDLLAWDSVHDELVTAWSRPVATPVHNLYSTVWRVKPIGRIQAGAVRHEVGKSPAKHLIDGISAFAVASAASISWSRSMTREGASGLAVLRAANGRDSRARTNAGAAAIRARPRISREMATAGRARFRWIADMSSLRRHPLQRVIAHLSE